MNVCTQAPDGDDVTDYTPGDVGGADGEAEHGAESEGRTEPTETEDHETREDPNAEPGEGSELVEGDPPADVVRFNKPLQL